jgi:hypothetical protein
LLALRVVSSGTGIRSLALATTLLLAQLAWADAAAPLAPHTEAPQKMGAIKRAVLREVVGWRSIIRRPARVFRFAATSALSIGAGYVTNHLTGSPSAASFVSFTTGVIADRIADRLLPGSRPLGALDPPPLLRDGTQTLAGASVAAIATPVMMHALSHAGANAPGLFGLGAQLFLSRPIVQGVGGFIGGLLASGTRAGIAKLLRMHPRSPAGAAD